MQNISPVQVPRSRREVGFGGVERVGLGRGHTVLLGGIVYLHVRDIYVIFSESGHGKSDNGETVRMVIYFVQQILKEIETLLDIKGNGLFMSKAK